MVEMKNSVVQIKTCQPHFPQKGNVCIHGTLFHYDLFSFSQFLTLVMLNIFMH